MSNKFAKRTRLKLLDDKLHLLNINGIYKPELAKFIVKVYLNKLPTLCSKYLSSLKKWSSIHSYSTRNVSSNKYYVQRTIFFKTNQSLRVSGFKI